VRRLRPPHQRQRGEALRQQLAEVVLVARRRAAVRRRCGLRRDLREAPVPARLEAADALLERRVRVEPADATRAAGEEQVLASAARAAVR
jgi:hypothetical protein